MASLCFICLLAISGFAQVQSLPIGKLSNGTAVITQQANAERVLRVNLPENATFSDIKLEYSEYDKGYYLTARVTDSKISAVAILLNTNGNDILALAGPGVQIECHGYKCADCRPTFRRVRPICKCFDTSPASDTRCDMVSKITIGV